MHHKIIPLLLLLCMFTHASFADEENPMTVAFTIEFIETEFDKLDTVEQKEKWLKNAIERQGIAPSVMAELQYRLGKIQVVHTNIPAGIARFENLLEIYPDFYAIEDVKKSIDNARRKQKNYETQINDPQAKALNRFRAYWGLGDRDKAINIIKTEMSPDEFPGLYAKRLVNSGYLCPGEGPETSFQSRSLGSLWWCSELEK